MFSRFIVDEKAASICRGARVCELGAGCGLPGLVAATYNAPKEVLVTDYFAHTVENLQHNVDLNSSTCKNIKV